MRLSLETRLHLASVAEQYIADLVAKHGGDNDDVRSLIADLHDQATFGGSSASP
jgi:hypothetical protein